jgi:recombinational DNA repair ATPase RecF
MKILELEIKNIRGIKDIILKPNGKNIVVYGPNGSGKSAVVDSIEFLLTGKISRLSGDGTKNLSLKEHGPHVDYREKLKDVFVKGKIKIDEYKDEIEIERKMTNTKLSIKPKEAEEYLRPYLFIAEMGQHVLTRREILKYITAESGKRANEIQSLLNLDKIENIRKMLVSINHNAESEMKSNDISIASSKQSIKNLLIISEFNNSNIIEAINERRNILNASKIKKVDKDTIKEGIKPLPKSDIKISFTKDEIENKIKDLKNYLDIKKSLIISRYEDFGNALYNIFNDKRLKKDLLQKKLIELGISLIDENGNCPLCEKEWEKGELIKFLYKRVDKSEVAEENNKKINIVSTEIKRELTIYRNLILDIIEFSKQIKIQLDLKEYELLDIEINDWLATMLAPIDSYENKIKDKNINSIFNSKIIIDNIIIPVESILKTNTFEISKEQLAWDTLTKLEALWEVYEKEINKSKESDLFKIRSEIILEKFQNARDTILENTYEEIKDKFNNYYKEIHQGDEENFDSSLKHVGAELILEVDFYKRGLFPPHALHSEGHQDSMGICLYLALNKHLTKDKMKLTVLDDVLMSIDNNHRRSFCHLLSKNFSDRQFFITTHDTIWAKQIKSEGLVEKKNMIHFTNWTVDMGPFFEYDKDLWDKINIDLLNDEVPSAAHKLRRESEYFFESLCESLRAKIEYKGDGRYEFGDYISAVNSIYREYLRKALNASKHWSQEENIEKFNKLISESDAVIKESQIEQWIINDNVHFNKLLESSKEDFIIIVESYKKLFNLFKCTKCQSNISLTYQGIEKKSVNCSCNEINWNLITHS